MKYFSLPAGHDIEKTNELKHLPLPESARDEVTAKLQLCVSAYRILSGINSLQSHNIHCMYHEIF